MGYNKIRMLIIITRKNKVNRLMSIFLDSFKKGSKKLKSFVILINPLFSNQ